MLYRQRAATRLEAWGRADPEQAIKAFGAAMQAIPPIPKAKADGSSEEAA
ncbi:MAG TPA: hypothetical protein VNY82_00655 [Steroidobacteraceae bacterium]|nr:hypothetical protein [Steroidobacteraceae bacterium]